MEEELLQDLRNYLGSDYTEEQEPTLLFCIKRAITTFKNKRDYPAAYSEERIKKDMEKKYACIWDDVLYWCNMQGVEFQKSHSENGVLRSWSSEDEIYSFHGILPIARIV